MRKFENLVDPAEAVKLFGRCSLAVIANVRKFYEVHEAQSEEYKTSWGDLGLLGFIYQTGRVQGIREERAKKKGAAQ